MDNEPGYIVHPQIGRYWIGIEQILDYVDHIHSLAEATHPNHQTDSAVFIDHVQGLEHAPVYRLIELGVDRQDVLGLFGTQ